VTHARVIVLIGVPGSGKSTWAASQKATVLSSDAMRLTLSGSETDQTIHGKVFAAMRYLLRQRLAIGGQDTIIDATNVRRKDRKAWIQLAQKYNASPEAVYFNLSLEQALRRNRKRSRVVPDEVIRSMFSKLQPPIEDEGFTKIVTISA
jgi:predicted kinase